MLITNSTPNAVKVVKVDHWSDRLFSFTVERPKSFRFRSGEFVMIGLLNSIGKPILRAYSITSPSWDEKLSFYSIKIKNGPLTSKLQKIKKGDFIIMERKSVGTLVLDALLPGNRIFLFSTGTGINYASKKAFDPKKGGAYTKKWGYKLVPSKIKTKGLEVKQLFEAAWNRSMV